MVRVSPAARKMRRGALAVFLLTMAWMMYWYATTRPPRRAAYSAGQPSGGSRKLPRAYWAIICAARGEWRPAEKGAAAELVAIKANMSFRVAQVEDDNSGLQAEVQKLRDKVAAQLKPILIPNLKKAIKVFRELGGVKTLAKHTLMSSF